MAMTKGEVALHLRELCLDFFGPGYPLLDQFPGGPPGQTWEDVLIYVWLLSYAQGQPEHGMSVALINICQHGGDDALRARASGGPYYGTFRPT